MPHRAILAVSPNAGGFHHDRDPPSTFTDALTEREAQFSELAQEQHRWQALCDAVGFELIAKILREESDPMFASSDAARFEQHLAETADRFITARGHADFNLRELRHKMRSGHINKELALTLAYRIGRADEAQARGAILDPG